MVDKIPAGLNYQSPPKSWLFFNSLDLDHANLASNSWNAVVPNPLIMISTSCCEVLM
uniref:Uncharacterized protein n=1 Tax=Arundo donax TaxID=35708 RepID=A0A0A8XX34_ARUDO